MKNKMALFGEEVLSGALYDENNKLLNCKSSYLLNKLSSRFEVHNYSTNKMNSNRALVLLKKVTKLKYKYKTLVINLGVNEAIEAKKTSRLGIALKIFEQNVLEMINICKENKIQPIVVGLPKEEKVNEEFNAFSEALTYICLSQGIKYVSNREMYFKEAYTVLGQQNIANNLFLSM